MPPPASARNDDMRVLQQQANETADIVAEHEARLDLIWQSTQTVTEQIQELSGQVSDLKRDVPTMVKAGIVAAVGDPDTWAAMREGMRKSAEKAAGGWVMASVRYLLSKAFSGLFVLALVYAFGGLPAVLAVLKMKASEP